MFYKQCFSILFNLNMFYKECFSILFYLNRFYKQCFSIHFNLNRFYKQCFSIHFNIKLFLKQNKNIKLKSNYTYTSIWLNSASLFATKMLINHNFFYKFLTYTKVCILCYRANSIFIFVLLLPKVNKPMLT